MMRVTLLLLMGVFMHFAGICQYTTTVNDFTRDRALFDSDMARGNNNAEIPLSGTTDAPNGSYIEARALSVDDGGSTTTSWAVIDTVSSSSWNGILNVPRSSSWYRAETRVQGSSATDTTSNRFGVGLIVFHSGQSNYARVATIDGSATPMTIGSNKDNFQMWKIENRGLPSDSDSSSTVGGPYFITDANPRTDALQAMASMYHKNAPGLKVMVLFDVKPGIGQGTTLKDSDERRMWESILKLFGRGVYSGTGPMADGQELGIFVQAHMTGIPTHYMSEWYMAACLGKKIDGSDIPGISKTSGFASTDLFADVGGSGTSFTVNHIWPEAIPGLLTGRTQVQLKDSGIPYSADEYPEKQDYFRQARETLSTIYHEHFYWADEYPFIKRFYADGSNSNHVDIDNIYGSPLKGQALAVSVLRQIGAVPFTIPRFDIINKTSDYIELGSTEGPITTIARMEGDTTNFPADPITAPGSPGDAEALGFQYADFTAPTRVEIVDSLGNSSTEGLIRVYLDSGYTELYYGMKAAGLTAFPMVGFDANEMLFMRHLPIVDVGLEGRFLEHGVWVTPYTEREFINFAGSDTTTIAFYDDFEDGDASGWITSDGSWSVVQDSANYVYEQSTSNSSKVAVASVGSAHWTDYSFETIVKPLVYGGGGIGLSFRFADTDNKYQVYIKSSTISISKKVNGDGTTLHSESADMSAGSWYKLRVDVHDNIFDLYLNDTFLFTAVDSLNSLPSGKIGIGSWKASAQFDDVNISEYTPPPAQDDFEDDFEDGDANGWTTTDGLWSVTQESGNYVYKQRQSNSSKVAVAEAGDSSWTDYSFEARVKPLVYGGGGIGLSFRFTDTDNKYQVYIKSTTVSISKKVNGVGSSLNSDSVNMFADNWYKLRVDVTDSIFDLYLNDTFLFTAVDSLNSLPSGKIGVGSWKASAQFDDVFVVFDGSSARVAQEGNRLEFSVTKPEVQVYPVPAVNQITISNLSTDDRPILYDIHGKSYPLRLIDKTQSTVTYDVSALPKGMYILKVNSKDSETTNRKIFIN